MKKNGLKDKIQKLEESLVKPKKSLKTSLSSIEISLEFSFAIIFCGFIGFYLDKYFTTSPILFIILLLIGIFVGLKNIFLKL